jgi:hypothetical protein
MLEQLKKVNSKILLAVIAGTAAGVVAGLLMVPDNRKGLKKRSLDARDMVNNAFKKYFDQAPS